MSDPVTAHSGQFDKETLDFLQQFNNPNGSTGMWTWKCSKCGHSEKNYNTVKKCAKCDKNISCKESGGHEYPNVNPVRPYEAKCNGFNDDGITPCDKPYCNPPSDVVFQVQKR